jgi:ADP-ribose pyrophosphatase YjhB (NUDIX family)
MNRPICSVISSVIRHDQILLVRRANPPDAGYWGFPGGKMEFGEPILAAAGRELLEETGVYAEPQRIFTAVDAFDYDDQKQLRYHYVLLAVQCKWLSGEPVANDDALDARWFQIDALDEAKLTLSVDVVKVARQSVAIAKGQSHDW